MMTCGFYFFPNNYGSRGILFRQRELDTDCRVLFANPSKYETVLLLKKKLIFCDPEKVLVNNDYNT